LQKNKKHELLRVKLKFTAKNIAELDEDVRPGVAQKFIKDCNESAELVTETIF